MKEDAMKWFFEVYFIICLIAETAALQGRFYAGSWDWRKDFGWRGSATLPDQMLSCPLYRIPFAAHFNPAATRRKVCSSTSTFQLQWEASSAHREDCGQEAMHLQVPRAEGEAPRFSSQNPFCSFWDTRGTRGVLGRQTAVCFPGKSAWSWAQVLCWSWACFWARSRILSWS